jgi:hypothetical protein
VSEDRIADLERRVAELERERNARRAIGPIEAKPATQPLPVDWQFPPMTPGFPLPSIGEQRCPKCGIALSPIMSYSCAQAQCPTGLGGVSCSVRISP